MKRAVVCALSGVGNCITTLPLIQALGKLGYKVDVRIAESRGTRVIFEDHPDVSKVLDVAEPTGKYDVACCTHMCKPFFEGCNIDTKKRLMIRPGKVKDFRPGEGLKRYTKHEVEHNFDLARELGYTGSVLSPILPTTLCDKSLNDDDFKHLQKKGVILGVGYLKKSAFDWSVKHWGNLNFARFAKMLVVKGFTPILLGGPDEEDDIKEILKLANNEKIKSYTNLIFPQVFHLMVFCRICVTNETFIVPASHSRVHCLSLVFDEAPNNPKKTHPYPTGTALTGKKSDMTPEVVMTHFENLLNDGPQIKIKPVNDTTSKIEISDKSRLWCIRAGLAKGRPGVSIVVLVCDLNSNDLRISSLDCINRIQETALLDAEIIIVANAPSERLSSEIRKIESKDDRIVSISMNQNLGVIAKNFAYNLAQGQYIISIDGDVHVEKGWIEKFLEYMNGHPDVGIIGPCGGRIRKDKWSKTAWGCGDISSGPRSIFGYEDSEFFGAQTVSGKDGTVLDVIPSMCWCFRRLLFKKIGYLDWRFGPFVGSDADFCLRIKEAGMEVHLVRIPIRHVSCGGSSHSKFVGLTKLIDNHVEALYNRWYGKYNLLCEIGRNKL